MNKHTEGRTEVSTSKWLFGLGSQIFLSVLVIGSVYTLNAGQSEYSGFMALGGVIAVMYFSSMVSGTPHPAIYWALKIVIFLFTATVLVVEMFSMFASYMASSAGSDLEQYREIKANAKDELERLKAKELMLIQGDFKKGDKGALLAENSRAIKAAKSEAKLVIDSNQKKAFSDLNKKFGVDNVEGIYRAMLGTLLVLALPLIAASRNSTWCGLTLWIYNQQRKVLDKLLNPTETKNAPPADLETQGTQENKPKVIDKFNENLEKTERWVNGHPFGVELSTTEMRKATGTSKPTEQNVIISKLYDNDKGILTRVKKGNIYKYSRARRDVKQAVLNEIGKTKNIFSIYKKGAV